MVKLNQNNVQNIQGVQNTQINLANIDISLAGEYYVAAKMHLQGWAACMTLKNYPGIDILGYNPTTGKRSEIQIKTGHNQYTVLTSLDTSNFNTRIQQIKQPYVFVHILSVTDIDCYILKPQDFITLAQKTYQNMKVPAQGKKAPVKFKWSDLLQYKNQWQNLW